MRRFFSAPRETIHRAADFAATTSVFFWLPAGACDRSRPIRGSAKYVESLPKRESYDTDISLPVRIAR